MSKGKGKGKDTDIDTVNSLDADIDIKKKEVKIEEDIIVKKEYKVKYVEDVKDFFIPEMIEIRPIEKRQRYHRLNTAKLDRSKTIRVLPNMNTMKYDLDLTEEEIAWAERKLGFPLELDYNQDPKYINKNWDTSRFLLKLKNETTILRPRQNAYDFIKYKSALKDNWVANNLEEWENGIAYDAKFYIYDKFEKEEKAASRISLLNSARKISYEMTLMGKKNLLRVLKEEDYTHVSENIIDVKIDQLINDNPRVFIEYATMDKEEMRIRSIIIEAISRRVIVKKSGGYYYRDIYVGVDTSEISRFLTNPQNQSIKLNIIAKIENLKK